MIVNKRYISVKAEEMTEQTTTIPKGYLSRINKGSSFLKGLLRCANEAVNLQGLNFKDLGQQFSQTYILSLASLGSGIVLAGTYPNGKILRSELTR